MVKKKRDDKKFLILGLLLFLALVGLGFFLFSNKSFTGFAVYNASSGNNTIYECGTINSSGYYELNQSFSASGNCLVVQSDNVIIDCNGSSIGGGSSGYGVSVSGYNNLTVLNCNLISFSEGIYLYNSSNNTIQNSNLSSNGMQGLSLESSAYNNILNSTFSGDQDGIFLDYSTYNNILNSIFSENHNGILLEHSSYNNITNNLFEKNIYFSRVWDGSGIYFELGSLGTRQRSTGGGSTGGNENTEYNIVKNNNFTSNYNGVFFSTSSNNLVYNNYFINNTNLHIYEDDTSNNLFNITKDCSSKNIIGGNCTGGNYYDDYYGADTDGDGIGEMSYNNMGHRSISTDYLPLTNVTQDSDNDGYADIYDNCINKPNGIDSSNPQADNDNDGIGDVCDSCPLDPTNLCLYSEISFQGYLVDSSGNSLDGNYSIKFNLYGNSTGGNSLWNETQDIPISNGFFVVYLGSVNPLFLESGTYWLGMNVNNDGEMSPRVKVNHY